MSKAHAPSFEEVNKHIEAVNLAEFRPGGTHHPKAAASLGSAEVCAAYKMVKPILVLIASIPLIPQKWRDALNVFIEIADKICPAS